MICPTPQLLCASVFHRRFRPRKNSFRYKLFYLCWRLSETQALRRKALFGVNTPALLSYYDRDHGLRDGSSATDWVLGLFAANGVDVSPADVVVVTMPRIFGYVFNPVSFWIALDSRSRSIRAVLAEVNNTFSEGHCYLCLPPKGATALDREWISAEKVFHVSPFLKREGTYHFFFALTEKQLAIAINYVSSTGEKLLETTLAGKFRNNTSMSLLRTFVSYPLQTLRVVFLIHWQALKLLLKGATFVSKPKQLLPSLSVTGAQVANKNSGSAGGCLEEGATT